MNQEAEETMELDGLFKELSREELFELAKWHRKRAAVIEQRLGCPQTVPAILPTSLTGLLMAARNPVWN